MIFFSLPKIQRDTLCYRVDAAETNYTKVTKKMSATKIRTSYSRDTSIERKGSRPNATFFVHRAACARSASKSTPFLTFFVGISKQA